MNKKLLKDDFFEAVNGKKLAKMKIPGDKPGIGSFSMIDQKLQRIKKTLFNKWLVNDKDIQNYPMLKEMIKFYKLTKNWQQRKINGVRPLDALLTKINNFNSWNDIINNYEWLILSNLPVPFKIDVSTGFEEPGKLVLWMDEYPYILPEKSYYDDEKKKTNLLGVFKQMATKILNKIYSKQQTDDIVDKTINLDAKVSKYVLTREEQAKYYELNNPRTLSEIQSHIEVFDVEKLTRMLVGEKEIKSIIVPSLIFLNNFNKIFNKDNFEEYKASLIVNTVLEYAKWLDNTTRKEALMFRNALSGINKFTSNEKVASDQAEAIYKMVYGKYYGEVFFGSEAKKQLEAMIETMKDVYKESIRNNDWLEEATKQMAIKKLTHMDVMVGYPEEIEPYYNEFFVQSYNGYDDLLQNVLAFQKIRIRWEYDRYLEIKNKKLWSMTPAMVNAYFQPTSNHIVFPAGILQAPFYSTKQTLSQNFGGIGVVIAHEISHSFDNNGAKFDERGVLHNWWTKKDEENFEKKIKQMIQLFDKVKITNKVRCNGTLTVSENIADCGGVSCAYESAKRFDPKFNPKQFFKQYAIIWRSKYREQFIEMLANVDVHAPVKLRTNLQLKNNIDFQKTFNIKPGDKMYLSPKKIFKIW
ncbi:M13 family metallopeptidase [[Mycoplasma] anseris]|uniref:M13 family peptidase n=1 Tax=[Mycoplasma] anseris TaxID=92400 RepID=A0A2Z4ND34_9BACT|nr:M13 family metallopeptidase [[Mycoplasma] anseris]AWX69478.1 M13 family peptidase [[Mycoplasma] anseris]